MEDRGRSSRTYENRRTYGKSQGRRPSDNHPPGRQRTPAERARMRRRRKRQRMIRFVLLIILIIAAIAGILLNIILPGNDYEFGVNPAGDENRGIHA